MATVQQTVTNAAIALSGKHANLAWKQEAFDAVVKAAKAHKEFTVDEVWPFMSGTVSTHEKRAMGAVMRRAVKAGVMRNTGRTRPTTQVQNHSNPTTIWESLI